MASLAVDVPIPESAVFSSSSFLRVHGLLFRTPIQYATLTAFHFAAGMLAHRALYHAWWVRASLGALGRGDVAGVRARLVAMR